MRSAAIRARTARQPTTCHLEPPDLFIEYCFLRLLLPLFAFAFRGEDSGPVLQQVLFPGQYQDGMNLVLTR